VKCRPILSQPGRSSAQPGYSRRSASMLDSVDLMTRFLGMSAAVAVRHTSNFVVALSVWVFCLLAMVDGVLRGSSGYVLHAALVAATVSLAAWMIFARPRLIADDNGLRMINILRDYDIPFGALVSWHVGGMMTAEIRTGTDRIRKVTSWGAPGVKRQRPSAMSLIGRAPKGNDMQSNDRQSGTAAPSSSAASRAAIESRSVTELAVEFRETQWRRDHPKADETIARIKWNWPQLLALAALLIANVAVG
jgi:hypothetical protein